MIEGISWQWIFWLNVPVGLVLAPLAARRLDESHGRRARLDLPGLALGVLRPARRRLRRRARQPGRLGLDRGGRARSPPARRCWSAFVAWELRARAPMLPMRFFRSRAFAATNGVSLAMTFGIFGSIFLLAQFFQTVQGYSPLEAGLRTLPWTGMPMIVAPIAGILSDRLGSRPLMAAGLFLQAVAIDWIAAVSAPDVAYGLLVPAFVMGGTGMALVFAPGRERGARRGAARGGRPGVRRQQRDPRARRRARRRGAGGGVHRRGRVRDAAGVRRRARARAVGRRRRARRRRPDRAADPRQGRGAPVAGAGVELRPEPVAA